MATEAVPKPGLGVGLSVSVVWVWVGVGVVWVWVWLWVWVWVWVWCGLGWVWGWGWVWWVVCGCVGVGAQGYVIDARRLARQQFRFWEGTASMRGAVRGSVKACCRARRGRRARRSLFSSINFLPRTAPRPALWQKQQAQTERSHRRKEEEATRNRFMGFCEKNTRDKKKAREQNASTNTKRTEATPSRGLQGSLNSRIANSNKTQAPNKRKRHDTKSTCEGFHTKPCMEGSATERKMRAN